MAALASIKGAFSSYTKNIVGYFLSSLVYFIWMLVAIGLPFGLFALSMLALGAISTGGDVATTLVSNPLIAIVFGIWMLIVFIIQAFFVSSGMGAYINACYSIATGKVPTVLGMIEFGIKNGGRFLVLMLVICAIFGIFLLPAMLSFILVKNALISSILLLGAIGLMALVKFLFMFCFPAAAIDKTTPLGALSRSLRLVTRNIVQCIIFAILFGALSLVLGFIPIINMFVLAPILMASLALFYKSLN